MHAKNLLFLGEPGVGKSALIGRLSKNLFEAKYRASVGLSVVRKDFRPLEITFYFYDLQGYHMPDALLKTYLQGADAYILVCDAARHSTYSSLELYWAERIERRRPVILVENKADLVKNLTMHAKHLFRLEQKMRAKGINVCYSTLASAKTGFRVGKILQKAGEICLKTS